MTSAGLTPAQATRRHEIQGLQFVRANAAIMVVVTHSFAVLGLSDYFATQVLGGVFDKAKVGVFIFFVVSGFIIVFVSLRDKDLKSRTTMSNFLLKRFVRIVPFLWIAVIAYALIRLVGAHEFNLRAYFDSLFLFPVGEVDPNVLWTLRHEALFYLIFAVAFLLRRRFSWLLWAWCASPIVVWVLGSAGVRMPGAELFTFVFDMSNAYFGCGVILGLLVKRFGLLDKLRLPSPWIGWILVCLGCALAFAAEDSWGPVAVAVAATFTVGIALVTPKSRTWFARFWEFLGNASYAIYLTHPLVLAALASVWIKGLGRGGLRARSGHRHGALDRTRVARARLRREAGDPLRAQADRSGAPCACSADDGGHRRSVTSRRRRRPSDPRRAGR